MGLGRSPPRKTAKAAVTMGKRPKNTKECAEVMCCKASALNKGKPITTPSATIISEIKCLLDGRFSLNAINTPSASNAAIVARATVTKIGLISITANLVAGIEPLKISTAINPLSQPLEICALFSSVPVSFMTFHFLNQRCKAKRDKYSISFVYLYGYSLLIMEKIYRYNEIASGIAAQIRDGILRSGDKLPSVRMLCKEYAVGMNTAKRVFLELEAQSLVEAKPQSGFFVSNRRVERLPLPAVSKPSLIANRHEPSELSTQVYSSIGRDDLTLFSIGVPSGSLLPLAKLKKEILYATRALKGGGTEYEPLQGNVKLRRMVAVRSLSWGGNLHEDDLITTAGGVNALSFCLMALGKPGDTVAIESPCYPGILQLVISLGLKVLELPTHPVTGIEIDALRKVVSKINICLLIPNFNTPLGSCMPDAHKKEVVQLLAVNDIPLIEDDIYGDLYFGTQRPRCCKSFDTEGNVLWCSAVSKTLAPGYRVGWVAPGKYKEKLLKLKLVHALASTSVIHEAVGNFLKTGRYDHHLHQLRRTLQQNYQHFIDAVTEYFPEGTRTTRPQGGLAIWIEFNKEVDAVKLYKLAMKQKISIAPGPMFTLQDQYQNCIRLCIGLPWSDELKFKLKLLGNLAKMM